MRNIVICCDGTSNEFGKENTNVVRLIQSLQRDADRQRIYYDPGVGTLPEPGLITRWGKWVSKTWGLAFGAGLLRNVEESYTYLMETWQPNDKVFLFGFSRGAYTVRVLAGFLHALGLLHPGNQNLLPYAMRLYKAARRNDPKHAALCEEFRRTFARPVDANDRDHRFGIHFVGLWDTVSSVGWAWNPKSFRHTAHNGGIAIIRHAMAIDERRAFFRQNLMRKEGDQDLIQAWFPGVHADVGGGYPEQIAPSPPTYSRLWQPPFEWILDEAIKAGMLVDPKARHEVLNRSPQSNSPWLDPMHDSLTKAWWPAEFFPKLQWMPQSNAYRPRFNLFRCRTLYKGELIHRATLRRIRDSNYRPKNLDARFIERVVALTEVPEFLPYAT